MKNLALKLIYGLLASYARRVIAIHSPMVIAVTGSVGKTSTKEAVYTVLSDYFGKENVRKNEGNLNAEIGIPLSILGYKRLPKKTAWPLFLILAFFRSKPKKYPKYLVLEMGVEHKGDLEYFSSIAAPDIAIITSVSAAHLVNFKNKDEYQSEKLSILGHLKQNGFAVLNFDEERLAKYSGEIKKIFVSINPGKGDYWADDIKSSVNGTEFRINRPGRKLSVKSQLIGRQMIYSSLFAFALADKLEIPMLNITKSLEKLTPVPGRMNFIAGRKETVLLDDTYNANPSSVIAAINALKEVGSKKRKVLVLGDMNELGAFEDNEHRRIAEYAKGKCNVAIFAGSNAAKMSESFGPGSYAFKNREEMLKKIESIVLPGDLVLIKASQNNNFFEEVVKFLMKDKHKAADLLVRQSQDWLRKKVVS